MMDGLKRLARKLWHWRYRSSKTGKFVSPDYAEHHPATTERERDAR